jgi:hypothetical protein
MAQAGASLRRKVANGAACRAKEEYMQYALLIYQDERVYGASKSGPALDEMVAKHRAFAAELGASRLGGAGLKGVSTATTVRTSGGAKTIHDGPFGETKEQLGGFYLIEAPDLDAAIAFAKKVPLYRDGAIEIRPLIALA